MKARITLIDFILEEWIVFAAGIALVISMLYTYRIPEYTLKEIQVIFILFVLFIAVAGLKNSGLISKLAQIIEKGRALPLKLVLITFFLSMFITIDVALVVLVPITLTLKTDKKGIIVILESLAANTGSSLTPFGNPQGLFIYWFYDLSAGTFLDVISPFSLSFLGLLVVVSLFVRTKNSTPIKIEQKVNKKAYIYVVLLLVVLLSILHILPIEISVIVILFALIFDRKALNIDYTLLLTFLLFFGIADNLKPILVGEIEHSGHVFLLSALASQVISNVPATLLFAENTHNWQALLWGANTGGLGGLFGSMARLIVYKIYVRHESTNNTAMFTMLFLVTGYMAMLLSMGLYYLIA